MTISLGRVNELGILNTGWHLYREQIIARDGLQSLAQILPGPTIALL